MADGKCKKGSPAISPDRSFEFQNKAPNNQPPSRVSCSKAPLGALFRNSTHAAPIVRRPRIPEGT